MRLLHRQLRIRHRLPWDTGTLHKGPGSVRIGCMCVQRQGEHAARHIVPQIHCAVFCQGETLIGGGGESLIQREIYRVIRKYLQALRVQYIIGPGRPAERRSRHRSG